MREAPRLPGRSRGSVTELRAICGNRYGQRDIARGTVPSASVRSVNLVDRSRDLLTAFTTKRP